MAKRRVDDEIQRDFSGSQLQTFLRNAGLPRCYPDLTPKKRLAARVASLTAWYDISRPNILCTDVEAFVRALYLWVEYYMKPANPGVYYFEDPLDKYDMVRTVMADPLEEAKPARSIVMATRRKGKTQTIIVEMCSMMPIVRPFTSILISEYNDTRTKEELVKIRDQIETNSRIHQDFRGPGELFPASTRGSRKWNDHCLQFLHFPNCEIMAHSMASAQRGRGPLFGVIDDPETEETCFNREWRRTFFEKVLNVYTRMFHEGGKLCWIGTPIHGGSCLALATKGLSEKDETQGGGESPLLDRRLQGWRRGRFTTIKLNDQGEYISMQPDRLSVKAFLEDLANDPISVRKEILCEAVTPGHRAFSLDPVRHTYLHCSGEDGEYMLDLHTRETQPWEEFLDSLVVFAAGDLATGSSEDSDFCSLVYLGVDPKGVIYVLDVYNRQTMPEVMMKAAYQIAAQWNCQKMGWEKNGMQVVVVRFIKKYQETLKEEGVAPPVFLGIDNAKKDKVRRVLTLTPLFNKNDIRFLGFDTMIGPDGREHVPLNRPRKADYLTLLAQVMEFTDEGLRGHDDAIDALEMAVRIAGHTRGKIKDKKMEYQLDIEREAWREAGVTVPPSQIPQELWTPTVAEEVRKSYAPASIEGVIPYV